MIYRGRTISVDNLCYYYTAVSEGFRSRNLFRLRITIHSEFDYSSECTFIEEYKLQEAHNNLSSLQITPALIVSCIRYAIQHGWNPKQPEQTKKFILNQKLISELNAFNVDTPSMNANILNFNHPEKHFVTVHEYKAGSFHRLTVLTLKLEDLAAYDEYKFVHFRGVEYFSGAYHWHGANLHNTGSKANVLKTVLTAIADQEDEDLDYFRNLYIMNPGTTNEIKIVAGAVEID